MVLLSSLLIPGSFLNFTEKTGSVIRVSFNEVVRDNAGKATELLKAYAIISSNCSDSGNFTGDHIFL